MEWGYHSVYLEMLCVCIYIYIHKHVCIYIYKQWYVCSQHMVLLIKSFKIASKTCLDNQQTCFFSDWVHHHFVILHVMLSHSQLEVPAIWTSACATWYLGSIILTFVWGCGPYLDILGPYLGWTCGPLSLPAMWVFTRKKSSTCSPAFVPTLRRSTTSVVVALQPNG